MHVLNQTVEDAFSLYNGDCVQVLAGIPDDSIDYCLYSPPFSSLFVYSNSDRDMGNVKSHAEFFEGYGFLVRELYRILKPGRLLSLHCMVLPTSKQTHGVIGLYDFPGDLIRSHEKEGFIFHSKVCIWKNPVVAMQRTKALGLLWKQLKKDAAMCRQGIPDEVLTLRKPGVNPDPITNTEEGFPVKDWQEYASPVWMDIDQSNTLNRRPAREDEDEKHIAPLQLDVIERCLRLWSREGDVVLSPFAGIGSEGYVAVKTGRKFIGVELKGSYYRLAVQNLREALQGRKVTVSQDGQDTLFAEAHE